VFTKPSIIVFSATPELVAAEVARVGRTKPSANPAALIRSLVRDRHNGPLEFLRCDVEVTAPIYVARHLVRYRTASWNERSLRTLPPLEENATYRTARANGVRMEDARAFLPLSTATVWRWNLPLPTVLHILEQRDHPHAQHETRALVLELEAALMTHWPIALTEARRMREGAAPVVQPAEIVAPDEVSGGFEALRRWVFGVLGAGGLSR